MFRTSLNGIDLVYWNGRLANALAFTRNALDAISKKEFVEDSFAQWEEHATRNVDSILNAYKDVNPQFNYEETRARFVSSLNKQYWERHTHFQSTILNLGLVEQCSIFESAITDTLKRIFINRPELLTGLMKKENIPIEYLIENAKRPLEDALREWKLRNFSRESLEKKLKFFEHHFAISRKSVCDPENFGAKSRVKFKGRGVGYISEIFEMRHLIVHDLRRPLTEFDGLKDCHEFLMQVLHGLLWEVHERFKLEVLALGSKMSLAADGSE